MASTSADSSKVIIYIRTELTYIPHLVQPVDIGGNQYVCLRLKKHKVAFTLIGAYTSPSSRFDGDRLRDIMTATSGPLNTTGGFNAHRLVSGSSRIDSRGRNLVEFVSDHELSIMNNGMLNVLAWLDV